MDLQQEGVKLLLQSLLKPASLETKLAWITDGIIQYFKADFCRIWLIRPGDLCAQGCIHAEVTDGTHVCRQRDKCLHLLASSGRYTHLDGAVHRRVPFGCYKIGQIASGEEHQFLITDVANDSRVHDQKWARNLGLTSFVGYQIRTPEGETGGVLALFSKHPILPSENVLLEGLSSAVALATQQSATEEALREKTTFLKTLLNALPFPVYYKDCQCRYIGFNKAYEKLIGKGRDQLHGKSILEIDAPAELADLYHAKDLELLHDQGTQVYETQARDTQGTMRTVILHKATFADSNGNILGLIGAIHDITELKKVEDVLHLQTVELEQEVAERQMAQESISAQSLLLEKEIMERRKAQNDLEALNVILEQRVQERTSELVEKNAEIHKAYEELKNVQTQMLHQDKMASIGQLAAGVAHEINNPMGFIISNLSSMGKYVEKIVAYLDAEEKVLAGCDAEIRQRSEQERQKYRIDHIRTDMPELIAESEDGAQRIRLIVHNLKSFSRVDSVVFAYSDINEGLESTLTIAWNELKYKTSIVKEYGQLPMIWCSMGQLNQVFLNILINAAHAIEEQGEIRITTWVEDDSVKVAISDTGCGMTPEALKHIYDPFYTTKEVGKGTGLGLAIAYDIIVNKHGGRIEVASEAGTGSTFTITLPTIFKNGGTNEKRESAYRR
jgi:PAS domain S-box-containing protein